MFYAICKQKYRSVVCGRTRKKERYEHILLFRANGCPGLFRPCHDGNSFSCTGGLCAQQPHRATAAATGRASPPDRIAQAGCYRSGSASPRIAAFIRTGSPHSGRASRGFVSITHAAGNDHRFRYQPARGAHGKRADPGASAPCASSRETAKIRLKWSQTASRAASATQRVRACRSIYRPARVFTRCNRA